MGSAPIEAAAAPTPAHAAAAQRFVPVMLPAPQAPPAPTPPPSMPSNIEIVLAGGRTLRVGSDVDTRALIRIVAALEQNR